MPTDKNSASTVLLPGPTEARARVWQKPTKPRLTPLEWAILRTVSYADVFDYPLKTDEIWRDLIEVKTSEAEVVGTLASSRPLSTRISCHNGYYTLPGRHQLVEKRQQREVTSARLWIKARHYGGLLAGLPFVRMVAVTGALAVNNATEGDDIDYLVVTEPGRLWLARAFTVLLVKQGARKGDLICPNYFLSTSALALPERDLFTAHELAQMVPLAGSDIYRRLLDQNSWAWEYLPNRLSHQPESASIAGPAQKTLVMTMAERFLQTAPGSWLENWEMTRKQARFSRQAELIGAGDGLVGDKKPLIEVAFNAQRCKGHFNQHGRETLQQYTGRLDRLIRQDAQAKQP